MAKTEKDGARKRLLTPVFRLSYPNLFVAKKGDDEDSKAKFGCAGIWTPKNFTEREKELWRAILGELNRVSLEAFKKEWKNLPDNIKRGLRDGAAKEGQEGYGEGTRFANMTTYVKPGIVDKDGKTIISPEEGNDDLIYPGCYCRAKVTVFAYGLKPGSKGKGVAIGLGNLQKIKDGERLDNRVAAEDDFDEDIDSKWLDDDGDSSIDGDEDEFG